jgi:hypothetical protein
VNRLHAFSTAFVVTVSINLLFLSVLPVRFRQDVKPESPVVHFGNYVEIQDGLYKGFRGWVVDENKVCDLITVSVDQDSIRSNFRKELFRSKHYNLRNGASVLVKAEHLKLYTNPWICGYRMHGSSFSPCGGGFNLPVEFPDTK